MAAHTIILFTGNSLGNMTVVHRELPVVYRGIGVVRRKLRRHSLAASAGGSPGTLERNAAGNAGGFGPKFHQCCRGRRVTGVNQDLD